MAKLYWRVKRNGKWTWRPATCARHIDVVGCIDCQVYLEEEE